MVVLKKISVVAGWLVFQFITAPEELIFLILIAEKTGGLHKSPAVQTICTLVIFKGDGFEGFGFAGLIVFELVLAVSGTDGWLEVLTDEVCSELTDWMP